MKTSGSDAMKPRPIFVNQQKAAEMLGMSVRLFVQLRCMDSRLMPAIIPGTKSKESYLVSDLEEWARSLKYPDNTKESIGGIWDGEGST